MFLRILVLLAVFAEANGFFFFRPGRARRRRIRRQNREIKEALGKNTSSSAFVAKTPVPDEGNYLDPF